MPTSLQAMGRKIGGCQQAAAVIQYALSFNAVARGDIRIGCHIAGRAAEPAEQCRGGARRHGARNEPARTLKAPAYSPPADRLLEIAIGRAGEQERGAGNGEKIRQRNFVQLHDADE